MGLLQDGRWVDQWYDTKETGGHFVRTAPQFRNWITSDGSAVLCANDEMGSYSVGDAKTQSIFDIWHGEKINNAREIHKKHLGAEQIEICKHCPLTRKRESESTYLGGKSLKISKYVGRDQTVGK